MTAQEMAKIINREAWILFPGQNDFKVKVLITDIKNSYGIDRYKVEPTIEGGMGSMWVNASSVIMIAA
tara:strand:- start:5094 stop:5297 length:204 start_codon:yes stop_codon:yes gene_type:complete